MHIYHTNIGAIYLFPKAKDIVALLVLNEPKVVDGSNFSINVEPLKFDTVNSANIFIYEYGFRVKEHY